MADEMNLKNLFEGLQEQLKAKLQTNRTSIEHEGDKGRASEMDWIEMLDDFLPDRYSVLKGSVIDSNGDISDSLDIIIFDSQYSPFILKKKTTCFVPSESIYATLEVKQSINREHIFEAGEKVESVRSLKRTSAPIPYADGHYTPKEPNKILGGVIALECEWKDPFGSHFEDAINSLGSNKALQIGCAVQDGSFCVSETKKTESDLTINNEKTAVVSFCFSLLDELQELGTVPAIKMSEYLKAIKN